MTLVNFRQPALRALLLLPLLAGIQTDALAQGKSPAAAATFDVCHDSDTGNWRYSGVVAVNGAAILDRSLVNIDYIVQNKTSATYADTLRAAPVADNAVLLFSSGTTLESCSGSACDTQKTWASILDTYNNGLYPGAPKHCPE